jgi:NAD(P)-dependent dehydrogenase (short-subunit alcohol dehydrogenase family)
MSASAAATTTKTMKTSNAQELRRGETNHSETMAAISMRGKVVVITGSNSGVGFASAKALALRGAMVVMACRDKARADAAAEEIEALLQTRRASGEEMEGRVAPMILDLASFESVRAFVAEFTKEYAGPHVLINNAGLNTADNPKQFTEDGFELCWKVRVQTQHCGCMLWGERAQCRTPDPVACR